MYKLNSNSLILCDLNINIKSKFLFSSKVNSIACTFASLFDDLYSIFCLFCDFKST